MRKLNATTMAAVAGTPAKLPRPIAFPDGRAMARIVCEASVPVLQSNAVAQTLTGTSVLSMIACLFASITTRFGDKVPEIVDSTVPFARFREMFQKLTGDDFLVISPTYNNGLPKRLRDILAADVIVPSTAQNGTANLTFEIARAFEIASLGPDAYSYIPGASQARQIQFEFSRGAIFDPANNWIQNGNVNLTFLADDVECAHDSWAMVPRIVQNEEGGLTSHGPPTPSGIVGMWEYGYPGIGAGATPLTLMAVRRRGDAPLHEAIEAARVIRDASYTLGAGGYNGSAYDLNNQVSVLVDLPCDADREDIPVGEGWELDQTGSELSPAKTAWLHIPVRTQDEWDSLAGANIADKLGAKLVGRATIGRKLTAGPASMEPMVIAHPSDHIFETSPGRLYVEGAPPVTHIPESVAAVARGQVAAHSAPAAKSAAAAQVGAAVAAAIPGGQSGVRGRPAPAAGTVAQRLGIGG